MNGPAQQDSHTKHEIVLSITIPVYNGEQTLKETLKSLASQWESGVEILISDNASTDRTSQIVDEVRALYGHPLQYYQNPENVGALKNIDLCFQRAAGQYVWLFGDDDLLKPGGVRAILDVIKQHQGQLGFISVNASIHGDNWSIKEEKSVKIEQDILFLPTQAGQLFDTLQDHIGLNPTIITLKKAWLAEESYRLHQLDFWPNVHIPLAIATKYSSYIVASPYVSFNHTNIRWQKNGMFLKIICEFVELVKGLDPRFFSKEIKQASITRWFNGLNYQIIEAKLNNWEIDFQILIRLIKAFSSYPMFWLKSIPLLMTPISLFKWMKSQKDSAVVKFMKRFI